MDVRKTDKIATHSQQDSVVEVPDNGATDRQPLMILEPQRKARSWNTVTSSRIPAVTRWFVTNVSASCGCTVADKPEAPSNPENRFYQSKIQQ